jgi:hypothetical protein
MFYRNRGKRSLFYRSRNQARRRQRKRASEFGLQMSAVQPSYSPVEEMALRD